MQHDVSPDRNILHLSKLSISSFCCNHHMWLSGTTHFLALQNISNFLHLMILHVNFIRWRKLLMFCKARKRVVPDNHIWWLQQKEEILSLLKFDWWLRYLCWNWLKINIIGPYQWEVNIGSGNGLVQSGKKPLPEPRLTQFYIAIWRH